MVFNSLVFAVFFALVLAAHALPLPWRVKKVNLALFSLAFYAAYRPIFLALLLLSASVDFALAHAIARARAPAARRAWLVTSLALNLGLLGFFKYGHFAFGWASVALPLGISFYTFESLSYIADVYRGRLTPTRSYLDYLLFLSFFPHLVAGPIVRAGDLLPQFASEPEVSGSQRAWGLSLIVLGLFQKMVLADAVFAPVVDRAFADPAHTAFVDAWLSGFMFSGQIFCDFSGYSTCAIGAALTLGIVLNANFRMPYAARSLREFWRRWHISLSLWFRDYVYIPLGGNRHGTVRTKANLLLTMALCGLWHGAGWTFILWGVLHGTAMALEGPTVAQTSIVRDVFALVRVHIFLAVTWIFFRAADLHGALTLCRTLLHPSRAPSASSAAAVACASVVWAGLIAAHLYLRAEGLVSFVSRVRWPWTAAALTAMVLAVCLLPGDERAFIYFQF